jgi:WD40 repeat protein
VRAALVNPAPVDAGEIKMSRKPLCSGWTSLGTVGIAVAWAVCYDSATDDPPALVLRHGQAVQAVAFAPDGRSLATGSGLVGQAGEVTLWDLATRDVRWHRTGQAGGVLALAFAPGGKILASGDRDGIVRLWDLASGVLQAVLPTAPGRVSDLAFTPDGRTLVSVSAGGTLCLWDPATGMEQGRVGVWDSDLGAGVLALSPDGQTLANAGRSIRLRDTVSGRQTVMPNSHSDWVCCLAFSADGRLLASGGFDEAVQVRDTASGQLRGCLRGHADWINHVVFSPNGRLLASAGRDHRVCVWETATGRLRSTYSRHGGAVYALAFSPDGKRLASGGHDQLVQLWAVE